MTYQTTGSDPIEKAVKHNWTYGAKSNGILFIVAQVDGKKLPVLAVKIDGDKKWYKVASFDSMEKAYWFSDILEEFFAGCERKVLDLTEE